MNFHRRSDFLNYSTLFLFLMLLLTMGLATWSGIQPMRLIHWRLNDVAIGIVAAILMMVVFSFVYSVRDQAEEILGPSLAACRWYDLILLAILVGTIEELLFRGVLETWMARIDPIAAFLGVNLLFGVLHAVSRTYALVAMALGCILSWLAHGIDEMNLLRPIVAHAVYDYIGFVWIAMSYQRTHSLRDEAGEGP